MPGEASAEGVHDHHKAWEILLFVVLGIETPIGKRLSNNAIQAIKVFPCANPEVV